MWTQYLILQRRTPALNCMRQTKAMTTDDLEKVLARGKKVVQKASSVTEDEGNEEIHCDEGSPQRKKSTAMSVVEEEELQTISVKKNSAAEVSRKGNEHRAGKKGGKNPTYTTPEVVAEFSLVVRASSRNAARAARELITSQVSNRGDRYDGPESGKRSRSRMLDDGGAEDEDAVEVAGSNLPKHAIPQTEGAMSSRKRGRPSKIPVSDNTGKVGET